MRFEGRDLEPYAEPVSASDLVEGEAYFSVMFVDEEMRIPVMETWIFIGRNLDGEAEETLYFQDVRSYLDGVKFEMQKPEALFLRSLPSELGHIFDFEHALESLMRCSIERKQ